MLIKAGIAFTLIAWGAIYPFFIFIRATTGRVFASIFLLFIFCGFYVISVFNPIIPLLEEDRLDSDEYQSSSIGIAIIMLALAIGLWLALHNKYFRVPNKVIERIIIKEARRLLEKPVELRNLKKVGPTEEEKKLNKLKRA